MKIISVADLITYRRKHEKLIERVAEARVPTEYGDFKAVSYNSIVDLYEHVAFVKGDIGPDDEVLVRVHSECLTGDVFGSARCDCGDQRDLALEAMVHSAIQDDLGLKSYKENGFISASDEPESVSKNLEYG